MADDAGFFVAYTGQLQAVPASSTDGRGFVVTWFSQGQDGGGRGVFAQRLGRVAPFDVDGNGKTDPLTDGLLALRYEFGFRGATLISGAVGLGCTRCTAPQIEADLAAMV